MKAKKFLSFDISGYGQTGLNHTISKFLKVALLNIIPKVECDPKNASTDTFCILDRERIETGNF